MSSFPEHAREEQKRVQTTKKKKRRRRRRRRGGEAAAQETKEQSVGFLQRPPASSPFLYIRIKYVHLYIFIYTYVFSYPYSNVWLVFCSVLFFSFFFVILLYFIFLFKLGQYHSNVKRVNPRGGAICNHFYFFGGGVGLLPMD